MTLRALPAKLFIACILLMQLLHFSCSTGESQQPVADTTASRREINAMLDSFNVAAAKADYNTYFNFYADDAIFTGTDATERWNKQQFMQWAKPIFDKGSAWNFTALERHVYFDTSGSLAWFDELLNTQMKICRGSGVVIKDNGAWKVKQYILSTTVPNKLIDTVVTLKAQEEDSIIQALAPENKTAPQQKVLVNIDAVKASPNQFKILLENEHVRVLQYSLKPGEKDNWHTHPPKSSYVVSGGKLKIYLDNGETFIADEKAATASWMDYVPKHYVENIGSTTITIVLTEIK